MLHGSADNRSLYCGGCCGWARVLKNLGLPPLAAHLFVFYLAILSAVTPPVCGAIFIAAGMAEADWVETAKFGLKLSFAAFILPFLFVYNPSLILLGTPLRTIARYSRQSGIIVYFSRIYGVLENDLFSENTQPAPACRRITVYPKSMDQSDRWLPGPGTLVSVFRNARTELITIPRHIHKREACGYKLR